MAAESRNYNLLNDQHYTYDELKELTRHHWCSECSGALIIAWEHPNYLIKCCKDKSHTGITRFNREFYNFKKEYIGMESKALTELSEAKMMERVKMAKFPRDLTLDQQRILARTALEYGLDPIMGELMIYQGNPYVRIDGRRRKAQESGKFDGISTRPATREEKAAREVGDGDYLFKAEVYRKGSKYPFEGWGKVTGAEVERAMNQAKAHNNDPYSLPIVKDPGDMAEKRAEAEALKRAFNLPLPSFEELGFTEPIKSKNIEEISEEIREETREEISQGNKEMVHIKEVLNDIKPVRIITKEAANATNEEPGLLVTTWGGLLQACHDEFGMQPNAVLAELNIRSIAELRQGSRTPQECYQVIKQVRS